ncbi:hypothetical protein N7492_001835 [Penicillium capsulatum]|uniref:Glycosyltransferase family 31 protein n=1 Tax=Penicillium capsulatum TaxID=69766 RepID=A0A9W9IUF3_9EURO|nr:hypothetical protein N7492_001835 [Penicillium capsulatum]KAJ6129116.1 hypothetical protein N7512_001896 [Penicillium capsulatum]
MSRPQQTIRNTIAILAFISILSFFFLQRADHTTTGAASQSQIHNEILTSEDCYIELDRLNSYGYDSVHYSRWEIAVERTKKFDKFSEKLDVPVPQFEKIDTGPNGGRKALNACAPTTKITAPMPPVVDASHLLFGVSTSQERLAGSLEAFSHWAGGTKARLFALVEPGRQSSALRQRAVDLDIDMTLIESDQEVLDRLLLSKRDARSQWGVIMDDDTFFPSMSHLVKRLATYDASAPQYIGALTEDINGVSNYGYMAYGGAGIFLSMPLLEEMDKHHDECAQLTEFGDKRISQCIYLHTTTKLTWDRDLHQLDFWHSDGSGFFESGRGLPLSLHHWKSDDWFPVDVPGMSKVSSVCGDECQLQRWRVGDSGNWFFVNGFSIIQHSYAQTWDPSPWARKEGWAYSLGPLRPKDEAKITLRLKEAIVDSPGSLRQIYTYDPQDGQSPYVMEVVWRVTKMA